MKSLLTTLMIFPLFDSLWADGSESTVPSPAETFLAKAEGIPSYEGTFIKMILTLLGLVVLVFLTIWILKKVSLGRFGISSSQKKISILEKKALSPKTLLYLVEFEGKKILISESQLEVRTISHPFEEDLYR